MKLKSENLFLFLCVVDVLMLLGVELCCKVSHVAGLETSLCTSRTAILVLLLFCHVLLPFPPLFTGFWFVASSFSS